MTTFVLYLLVLVGNATHTYTVDGFKSLESCETYAKQAKPEVGILYDEGSLIYSARVRHRCSKVVK